jgi:signal transduction histidine kinase
LLELAQSAAQSHEAAAAAAGRSIALELRDAPLVAHGDRAALRALLDNLLDNALQHGQPETMAPGAIFVRAWRVAPGEGALEVEDAGPGIPPDERERVFDRFYRREGAAEGGSGLGLAIVRRIAQGHGGRVELAEGAGGKGLRARVVLPIA